MIWECDKHAGLPRATYGPGVPERDGCGHCDDNMTFLNELLDAALAEDDQEKGPTEDR